MTLPLAEPRVVDSAAASRFQITAQGGPLVAVQQQQVLTLTSMQAGVDALRTAEARAAESLRKATLPYGKDAQNSYTRFARGPWAWGVGAGVLALGTYLAYQVLGPNIADYWKVDYDGRHYNPLTNRYFSQAVAGWIAASTGIGVTVAGTAMWGILKGAKVSEQRMARETLEAKHLAAFAKLHAHAGQDLERAAIGRVARDTLPKLSEREIYVADDAEAIIRTAAADADLGDSAAHAEAERHRNLIDSIRNLESGKGEVLAHVQNVRACFDKLTPEERADVADELRQRLFNGKVPRREDVPYAVGQELYQHIVKP